MTKLKTICYTVFIFSVLMLFYGCSSYTFLEYKPDKAASDIFLINGVKEYSGGFNLYIDFKNVDSLYTITNMDVMISYDSITLQPAKINPPYYDISAPSFDSLPAKAKFTLINTYDQYELFFNMKKEDYPKQIWITLHLEGQNRQEVKKVYDFKKVLLKFKKRKQYGYV